MRLLDSLNGKIIAASLLIIACILIIFSTVSGFLLINYNNSFLLKLFYVNTNNNMLRW